MFLIDEISRTLAFLFMLSAMLGVGLLTTRAEIQALLGARGLLLRSMLANFVVVPLVGVVMARTLPLEPPAATALLLLACTPGGVGALQFTTKIPRASLFAGGSALAMSLAAVFLSPVLIALFLPSSVTVVLPVGRALLFVAIILFLPLMLGILVRSKGARVAERLAKPTAAVSTILFFVVLVRIMGFRKEAMQAVGGEALLYMLGFLAIAMAVGWLMGGPGRETRAVLATVTGMRNVILCLLLAVNTFPDPAVLTPLVAFSALMVPPNMLLTVFTIVRFNKIEQQERESPP